MPTEPNVFLNRIGDMNRLMTGADSSLSLDVARPTKRLEANMLLNQTVLKKGTNRDHDKYIASLQEEIKSLKRKMEFVRETDEELYKLKCENERLRADYTELQSETVTDFTLKRDHDELLVQKTTLEDDLQESRKTFDELRIQCESLQAETVRLKQTILSLHSRLPMPMPMPMPNGWCALRVSDLKQKISEIKQKSYESRIDELLLKYHYIDQQLLSPDQLATFVKEALL
jgi:DNA repair exonuclease SbcCD ATPase subunit